MKNGTGWLGCGLGIGLKVSSSLTLGLESLNNFSIVDRFVFEFEVLSSQFIHPKITRYSKPLGL